MLFASQVRRQGEVVQKLAHMIGSSVKLYDMVLQFLRTLFLRTHNVHYCTLRAELLMALHDLEVQVIICHSKTRFPYGFLKLNVDFCRILYQSIPVTNSLGAWMLVLEKEM